MGLLAGICLLATSAVHAGVRITELMASNKTTLATAQGLYEDWIELRNDSDAAVDLAGWYLTDDPADLRKWRFPSTAATSPLPGGAYLIVFADDSVDGVLSGELHANFKLSAGGEYLALIEPDGETVAYQFNPGFPEQTTDRSYGIDAGSGAHAYFSNPTPGAANDQAIADAVRFSARGGTYAAPFSLVLSVVSQDSTSIRYTLDGSEPTSSSTLYESPIPISATTRVRARSFKSGLEDGPVHSETYLHLASDAAAFASEIPVVVIDNFGAGEIPLPESLTRQSSQIMIFEPVDGLCRLTSNPAVNSRAGIRRRGESTLRSTSNKPNLSVETWGEVDEDGQAIAPLGLPADSDWVLYAPWTIDTAMIRNPFIYEVSNEAGRYAVRTRFVEVFLNHGGGSITRAGDYYGVYILMEKIQQGPGHVDVASLPAGATTEPDITGGYVWKKDKDDPNDQNFIAAGKTFTSVYPKTMPPAQLDWLTNHLNAINATIPGGNYASLIDVESFADHHILNVFANNADGLNFSTFYHKDRSGRVRMGPIWDFDRSMGCDNDARASNPEVWSLATDQLFFFHSAGPLWFRSLALNDAEFWMVWVDRWQAMRNGPLADAAMSGRIEGYRAEIGDAALRNYGKWSNVLSAPAWSGKVDVMKNHVLTRARWIDDQLIDPPVFSSRGGLVAPGFQLSMTGPQTKYFTLNGGDPRARGGSPAGTAYTAPISITGNTLVRARAASGAAFVNAPSTWPWSAMTEAMFVVDPAPLAITEILYHPRPPQGAAETGFSTSDFEFIEIQNTGNSSCSLIGVKLLAGVAFDFTHGIRDNLGAGERGLLVANLEAFKARYPDWAALNILGEFEGSMSNSGEDLLLGYDTVGVIALADFDYEDDWYPGASGEGFSLVLRDPQSAASTWDGRDAWRLSSAVDGSPGVANPPPAHPQGTVVINEVLSHQDTNNPGDWIELHNTSGSSIDIGGWFLSDSPGVLMKYTIPTGTVIPSNGYVVFNEHDHFGSAFALSEHGDAVYLSSGSDGALCVPAYREFQDFGGQERDVTFGRHLRADGTAVFPTQALATMGAANSRPRVGPLVIEEIMYHPPTGAHEYVRIRNATAETVNLYDPANPANVWKVSGIDFEFPSGASLGANQSLLLVRDTITPAEFRSVNQVPLSVAIYNYAGALDDDSDSIVLKKPGTPDAGTGYLPYIIVDEVKYHDEAPWPPSADGSGKALGRIDPAAHADDPANWQAVDASYGPVMFKLAVVSGAGDGAYTAGSIVPIQADAPAPNQSFVRWIGNVATIADADNPSTSVTMPARELTISALYSTETTFIAGGTGWKYHDQGQDLGTAWRSPSYDSSAWPTGAAQLGYGDGDEATAVGFGGVPSNRHVTTYFRREFAANTGPGLANLSLELLRDDGAVVYVNGQEVLRDNMPAGPVGYTTLASSTVGGLAEDTFYQFALPPAALVDGTNVIAVEVHQRAPDSSDVSFDLRMKGFQTVNEAMLDGDADGMHDAWETTHFGSTEAALPDEDGDGDGLANSGEFVAGTLPGDASSFFSVGRIDKLDSGNGCRITWTAVPGRRYSVQWTVDLKNPFVTIADDLTTGSHVDTLHSSANTGFYRIRVEMD
jgi:hypothetical protein